MDNEHLGKFMKNSMNLSQQKGKVNLKVDNQKPKTLVVCSLGLEIVLLNIHSRQETTQNFHFMICKHIL